MRSVLRVDTVEDVEAAVAIDHTLQAKDIHRDTAEVVTKPTEDTATATTVEAQLSPGIKSKPRPLFPEV